jgi:hypothetical protein
LFKTPSGIVLLALGFIIAMVIFSALGGVLGAALLRKKDGP